MKTKILSLCLLLTLLVRALPAAEEPIDFDKARQISERSKRGETLTTAEEAYIKRAKAEHRGQQAAGNPASAASAAGAGDIDREKAQAIQQRRRNGEKLSAEDTAYLRRSKAARRANAPEQPNGPSTSRRSPNSAPQNTRVRTAAFTAAEKMSRRRFISKPR